MNELSGIDEQHSVFPVCCSCGETPRYWTLRNAQDERIWFYSREYSYEKLASSFSSVKRGQVLSIQRGGNVSLENFGSLHYAWCSECEETIYAIQSLKHEEFLNVLLKTAHEFYERGNYLDW